MTQTPNAEAGWRDIASAPKDTVILLYGLLDPHPDSRELYSNLDRPVHAVGYWDPIDEAWSLVGSTWLGPWIKPSHWTAILFPNPPHSGDL